MPCFTLLPLKAVTILKCCQKSHHLKVKKLTKMWAISCCQVKMMVYRIILLGACHIHRKMKLDQTRKPWSFLIPFFSCDSSQDTRFSIVVLAWNQTVLFLDAESLLILSLTQKDKQNLAECIYTDMLYIPGKLRNKKINWSDTSCLTPSITAVIDGFVRQLLLRGSFTPTI